MVPIKSLWQFPIAIMAGDNKLFTAVSAALFSPGTLTKKSPKMVRYDPITHDRIVYDNSTGVVKAVAVPQAFSSVPQSRSYSKDNSPFRNVGRSPGVEKERRPLAQSGFFSLSQSASLANITYAKTRKRTEYVNPITGVKGRVSTDNELLESLGTEPRVFANRGRFASSGELREAMELNRGLGDRIAGAKRAPVQSVAYVNMFDLKG